MFSFLTLNMLTPFPSDFEQVNVGCSLSIDIWLICQDRFPTYQSWFLQDHFKPKSLVFHKQQEHLDYRKESNFSVLKILISE